MFLEKKIPDRLSCAQIPILDEFRGMRYIVGEFLSNDLASDS